METEMSSSKDDLQPRLFIGAKTAFAKVRRQNHIDHISKKHAMTVEEKILR